MSVMTFKPGVVTNPNGRPKGVPNKLTIAAKEAIELAFKGIGGVPALTEWALNNQTAFYTAVWSKIIPRDISLDGAGTNLTMLFNFSEIVRSLKNVSTEDLAALERAATIALEGPVIDAQASGGNGEAKS